VHSACEIAIAVHSSNAILQDQFLSRNPTTAGDLLWWLWCWLLTYFKTPYNRFKCWLLFVTIVRLSFQLKQTFKKFSSYTRTFKFTLLRESNILFNYTNSMDRALFSEANSHSASPNTPCLSWNLTVHYHVHRRSSVNSILSYMSHIIILRATLILSSHLHLCFPSSFLTIA
jgi:hypothetical protein